MKDFEFDFENLKVYQKSLEFVDKVFEIIKNLPREYKYTIGDNLIRAALSIPNNIAEGSDKLSVKDRKRYFRISMGSARESVSVLIVLNRRKLLEGNHFLEIKSLAKEITSILYHMSR